MDLAYNLWPINRSILGEGNRKTLNLIQEYVGKEFNFLKIGSGTKIFDWTVPDEWNVTEAFIIDPNGVKILDFEKNNLHLVGYSIPVDKEMSLEDLSGHLHSLSDQPNVIPYVTNYYGKSWGFCISHNERINLVNGKYRVKINSSFRPGQLEIAEYFIQGSSEKEIFLSTYICHPSMANNELSGPLVCATVAKELFEYSKSNTLKFSVRIAFMPETIGSIAYINSNLEKMKKNIICGYVVTCVGDQRAWSFLPSRIGNTIADRMALSLLNAQHPEFKSYTWLDRGSDERQYCSPGIDLPVASVMRSKYATYPEYHTSSDKFGDVVTEIGIQESIDFYLTLLSEIQKCSIPQAFYLCEPNMGKRGLYPLNSIKNSYKDPKILMNILSFCDGKTEDIEIARLTGLSPEQVKLNLKILYENKLIYFEDYRDA
jgi:aminopeptidase-like protein